MLIKLIFPILMLLPVLCTAAGELGRPRNVFSCKLDDILARRKSVFGFTPMAIENGRVQEQWLGNGHLLRTSITVDQILSDGVRFMNLTIEELDENGKLVGGTNDGFNEEYAINWDMVFGLLDDTYQVHCGYVKPVGI